VLITVLYITVTDLTLFECLYLLTYCISCRHRSSTYVRFWCLS